MLSNRPNTLIVLLFFLLSPLSISLTLSPRITPSSLHLSLSSQLHAAFVHYLSLRFFAASDAPLSFVHSILYFLSIFDSL